MSGRRPNMTRRCFAGNAKAPNATNGSADDLDGLRAAWSTDGFFAPGRSTWQNHKQPRGALFRSTFSHGSIGRPHPRMPRTFTDPRFDDDISDDDREDDVYDGWDFGAGLAHGSTSADDLYTLALGGWLRGGTDAHGRSMPSALDPSQHSLSTDGALAQAMARSPSSRSSTSPVLRHTTRGQPPRRMLGGRLPRETTGWGTGLNCDTEDPFTSWEAKWAKLLSAEQEAIRAREAHLAEATRRRDVAAAAATAARAKAAQKAEEARHRTNFKAPPRDSRSQASSQSARMPQSSSGAPPPPPRPTPSRPQAPITEKQFGSWSEYESAWAAFDAKLAGSTVRYSDVPWPCFVGSETSVLGPGGASGAEAKKRIFAALRRWHPDKWQTVFDRIVPSDLASVKCRVKEVTEQILAAKARAVG